MNLSQMIAKCVRDMSDAEIVALVAKAESTASVVNNNAAIGRHLRGEHAPAPSAQLPLPDPPRYAVKRKVKHNAGTAGELIINALLAGPRRGMVASTLRGDISHGTFARAMKALRDKGLIEHNGKRGSYVTLAATVDK